MVYEYYQSWYIGEYSPRLFEHEEAKSKEEFEVDCKKALLDCLGEYLVQENSWADISRWIEYSSKSLVKYGYKEVCPITCDWFAKLEKRFRVGAKMGEEFPEAFERVVEYNKRYGEKLTEILKGKKSEN